MSEHGEKQPADVLRTKRLEIVDDEGKVRAVLGSSARTRASALRTRCLILLKASSKGSDPASRRARTRDLRPFPR
jgi:hypothetical protein